MMNAIERHAELGFRTLQVHAQYTGVNMSASSGHEAVIVDLLTSIMHLNQQYGSDLDDMLRMAKGRFEAETTMSQREAKADEVLAAYKFGDDEMDDCNVTVVGHDGWDRSNLNDFTKIVYVQYRDEPADADSHKVSFHVRFNEAGEVEDAYALEMERGNDIGCRGDIYAAAPAMA